MRLTKRLLPAMPGLGVLLATLAVFALAGAFLEAFNLWFQLGGGVDARHLSALGRHLGKVTLAASLLLGFGLCLGLPSVWGRTGAGIVRTVFSAGVLAFVLTAWVHAANG